MSIFPTKILLATDGSKDADLALSTAVDIASGTNSELHVITAAPGKAGSGLCLSRDGLPLGDL
jgi:nucleotide-binding universal stress UspA family protein